MYQFGFRQLDANCMHLFDQLQKGVWKENSIKCIQTWANAIGYISLQ
jgi:hypothetical protein